MSKQYIGIDCGLDGGIAVVDYDGNLTDKYVMPVCKAGKGRMIHIVGFHKTLEKIISVSDRNIFVIENPGGHAPSAAGLRSMTYSFAVAETIVSLLDANLSYAAISSRKWQSQFWTRPTMAKGQKFDTKAAALAAADRIFPNQDWTANERCKKAHDGIVDAALLAEYGRRMNY